MRGEIIVGTWEQHQMFHIMTSTHTHGEGDCCKVLKNISEISALTSFDFNWIKKS